MGFDEEIDQLKSELQTPALGNEGVKTATEQLLGKLSQRIQSKRLAFALAGEDAAPAIDITYVPTGEKLATISVNDDSSISFQSTFGADQGDDDFDDVGYFPPFVEYYDESEFMAEAPDMLKQGIAEYELDQEEDNG
ncbi:MAG TPA: hypothetical protein VKA94_15170 [Hyphomicrobiales bacterium]|nr:hypothetical protein [Hyphomicrobiales bacterium]